MPLESFPRSYSLLLFNGVLKTWVLFAFLVLAVYRLRGGWVFYDVVYVFIYALCLSSLLSLLVLFILKTLPKKISSVVASVCEVTSWFLLSVSLYVYFQLGMHIDDPIVVSAFRLHHGNYGVTIQLGECALALMVLTVAVALQFLLLKKPLPFIAKWGQRFRQTKGRSGVLIVLTGLLVFLVYGASEGGFPLQVVPGGVMARHLATERRESSVRPEYTHFVATPMKFKPHVIMALVESFRWDYLTPEITPHLHALTQDKSCFTGGRHYAGGHLTPQGAFPALYGIDSYVADPFTQSGLSSPALLNLRVNGYTLKAFDSSGLTSYEPPVVAASQFSEYKVFLKRTTDGSYDSDMVAAFLETWRARSSPLMAFLFFYAPHHTYHYPLSDRKFTPDAVGWSPGWQATVNRFKNSLHYMDRLVGQILPELDDETVLIIAGDHGEEFGEFGSSGHAAARFEDVRTRVALVYCFGKKRWGSPVVSANADLWPTFFDGVGVDREWINKTFTGVSLLEGGKARTHVPLVSGQFHESSGDMALVTSQGKILIRADKSYRFKITGYLNSEDQPAEIVEFRDLGIVQEFQEKFLQILKSH